MDVAYARIPVRAAVALAFVWAIFIPTAAAHAQTTEPPARVERLEFDPSSGAWSAVAPPVPGTEDGDLELARALLARNEFEPAREALKAWRKAYPESPRLAEGLFYSADVEVAAVEAGQSGDVMKAYKWYEQILDEHAGTTWADRSLRRELLVAEMFLFKGVKQWVWGGLLKLSATDEAQDILNRLADQRAPGTPLAEQALRVKADYQYGAGEFAEAEITYARLARDFPRGRFARQAALRSADAAFASFPGVDYDDRPLLEAEERYRRYAADYAELAAVEGVPERLARIRESRAQKEYRIGRFYERTGSPRAAAYYYRFVSTTWPGTTWAAEADTRLGRLGDPSTVTATQPGAAAPPMPDSQPAEPAVTPAAPVEAPQPEPKQAEAAPPADPPPPIPLSVPDQGAPAEMEAVPAGDPPGQ